MKQKARRSERSKTKKDSISQSRKTKEESEIKIMDSSTKSPESSVASSSKTVNSSKKTSRQEERCNSKRKEKETEKAINLIELNENMIEEVVQRVGKIPTGNPMDKAEEAMRGISRSPFTQWIVREVKPKIFNLPMLEKV